MIKEKDKKIHELEKEAIKVKEDNEREIKDLKDFKVKTVHQNKEEEKQRKKQLKKTTLNNKVHDKCDVCERKLLEQDKLTVHGKATIGIQTEPDRQQRVLVDSEAQTDEKSAELKSRNPQFEKYECFYCGSEISNDNFLEYHRSNCSVRFANRLYSMQKIKEETKTSCSHCEQNFNSRDELIQHTTLYHQLGTAVGFLNWRGSGFIK